MKNGSCSELILLLYLPPLQLFDLRWFESKHQFSSSSPVDCEPFGVQKVNWPSANIQKTASHLSNHCIIVWTPETCLF